MTLSPQEQVLATTLGWDAAVFQLVKEATQAPLRSMVFHAFGEEETTTPPTSFLVRSIPGVYVRLPLLLSTEDLGPMVLPLRSLLEPHGYTTFVIKTRYGYVQDSDEPDHHWKYSTSEVLGVLPWCDPYDFVAMVGPAGDCLGLYTADILRKLRAWEEVCRLEILGAGRYQVWLAFTHLPADLTAFAEDVDAFCPCILLEELLKEVSGHLFSNQVDELINSQTIADLAAYIRRTKSLYLWWD